MLPGTRYGPSQELPVRGISCVQESFQCFTSILIALVMLDFSFWSRISATCQSENCAVTFGYLHVVVGHLGSDIIVYQTVRWYREKSTTADYDYHTTHPLASLDDRDILVSSKRRAS